MTDVKLVENGKLSLQDKAFGSEGILNDSTVYGNIKDKRTLDITVENLLRHQGGFTTRYGDPMFNPVTVAKKMNAENPATMETMIQFVLSRRLGFTPGTSTAYSNVGYGTAKHIAALKEFGPTEIHRKTFIKNFVGEGK